MSTCCKMKTDCKSLLWMALFILQPHNPQHDLSRGSPETTKQCTISAVDRTTYQQVTPPVFVSHRHRHQPTKHLRTWPQVRLFSHAGLHIRPVLMRFMFLVNRPHRKWPPRQNDVIILLIDSSCMQLVSALSFSAKVCEGN